MNFFSNGNALRYEYWHSIAMPIIDGNGINSWVQDCMSRPTILKLLVGTDDTHWQVIPMTKRTAFSYVRLSSKKQISGTGESRQTAKLKSICDANNWELSDQTFADLGVSAWKGSNRLKGDLGTFIALAQGKRLGDAPVLILEAFDRWSRQDIDESESALIDLLKSGVDIHITFSGKTYTRESTKSIGERIEILLALKSAHDYSENLSKRVSAAMQRRKEAGKRMGGVNLALARQNSVASRQEGKADFATKMLPIVASIRSAGVQTLQGIADALNRLGHATRQGKAWAPSHVWNLTQPV